jgi:tetratricopeptide (TPR) repeat protein
LDSASPYDYFLLLDSNDEYRAPKPLAYMIEECTLKSGPKSGSKATGPPPGSRRVKKKRTTRPSVAAGAGFAFDAFRVHQRWFAGGENTIDYYNIRVIKANASFRYEGVVHEYIVVPDGAVVGQLADEVVLYQDRVADNDGKTFARWKKDAKLLKAALELNPQDTRSRYYLAQTYECLGKHDKALVHFEHRATDVAGFFEERFVSMMRCGLLDKSRALLWFLQAYDLIERAEPLIELAKMFRLQKQFRLAYLFAKRACELVFPSSCVLWVDRKVYSYTRWHEKGIVAYYVGQFEEGEAACAVALATGHNVELDEKNLEWYRQHRQKLISE